MERIYYQHNDLDEDGVNDAVCVYNRNFNIPLIGDYRGVEIARILYIPSRPDSVTYAEKIANDIVISQGGQDKNSIIGKTYFVEGPSFEGFADILGVNNDDTVSVRSVNTGKVYIVEKDDLVDEESCVAA